MEKALKMQLCHHLIETPHEAEGSKLQDVKKCLICGHVYDSQGLEIKG